MGSVDQIVVFGASGAIGQAMVRQFASLFPQANVHAVARKPIGFDESNVVSHVCDPSNEQALADLGEKISSQGDIRVVFVAIGLLHGAELMPEKALKDLSSKKFERIFHVNTTLPALIAKHFLPRMPRQGTTHFAALSARVGSISDNRLGGWYAYRASKAALNMVVKCAAIETARRNPESVVVTLHPGTVDSALSEPFQQAVRADKLFTPAYCAERLVDVLCGLTAEASGKCFAWDGQEVMP